MPKQLRKDTFIKVYLNADEKKQVEKLVSLSGKTSMSEFILEAALSNSFNRSSPHDDSFCELTVVLKKCFADIKSFQHQQQIMMYVMIQFSMFLASFSRSRDEIMEFYEEAYQGAIGKFGKEEG